MNEDLFKLWSIVLIFFFLIPAVSPLSSAIYGQTRINQLQQGIGRFIRGWLWSGEL